MMIRLLLEDLLADDPCEDAKYLAAFTEDNYGEFVKMINELKNSGQEYQIEMDGYWYGIDNYLFQFPKDRDCIPCLNVYVYDC